ncbi:MAG: PKD-like domain-containing protein [Flavobacteriaceae bacterium]
MIKKLQFIFLFFLLAFNFSNYATSINATNTSDLIDIAQPNKNSKFIKTFCPIGTDSNTSICSNTPLNVLLYDFIDENDCTFSWVVVNNPNVIGATSASTSAVIDDTLRNFTATAQQVQYIITPTSSNGCVGAIFTITAEVYPEPVGIGSTEVVCSNIPLNISLDIYVKSDNYTFTWNAVDNPNVFGEASTSTSSFIDDTLINTTNTIQFVQYFITPTSSNGCMGANFTMTVEVFPEPLGTESQEIINSEDSFNLLLNDFVNMSCTFIWFAIDNPNVSGESTSYSTSEFINDTLINNTTTIQFVQYYITPISYDGCVGINFTINIEIQPTNTMATSENILNVFSIYPNPVKNNLTVQFDTLQQDLKSQFIM